MSVSIKQTFRSGTLKRLIQLLRPYKAPFVTALAALAIASCINLIFPAVLRYLLNSSYSFYFIEHPWSTAGFLVLLFALQAISFYYRSLYFGIIGQNVVNDLRKEIFSSIIKQEISFFDKTRSGDLVSALSSDALLVQDAVSVKLSVFIRYSFQVVLGLLLMLYLSPHLTGLIIVSVPLLIFTSRGLSKKLKYWSQEQQQNLGSGSAIAAESFSNIRVVKAYSRETFEENRFAIALEKVLSAGIKRSKISAFFTSFISFLMNALLVVLLFYGFQRVIENSLSLGDLSAFILYGVIVAVSFAFVVSGYSEFVQSLAASERVFRFLDLSTEEDQIEEKLSIFNPEIELRDVSFSYPSRPDVSALHSVNFKIDAGKITALVGPSGAGKSTIVNLILKFYKFDSGDILVSGHSIDSISNAELRGRITYVPQEPQLFALSILENLKYAAPNSSQAEIEDACAKANLLEFIQGLPQGFSTEIGEKGVQLSAGQKQRLSIARAILRQPEILILDEATASLDSQNEFLIQQSLEQIMKGKTTLVIAHRLSTVKSADKVIVLDKGRIIQSGTHESLSAAQGMYREFVEKQVLASV